MQRRSHILEEAARRGKGPCIEGPGLTISLQNVSDKIVRIVMSLYGFRQPQGVRR